MPPDLATLGVGAPPVNPLTDIGWYAAWWAGDPGWTNPGDGGAVSSWRDGTGGSRPLIQATGAAQPTYRAGVAAFNNKPAIEFDGSADFLQCATGVFGTLSQPRSIVIVANEIPGGLITVSFCDGTATSNRHAVQQSSNQYRIFAGSTLNSGINKASTNAVLLTSYFNTASSVMLVNGVAGASGTVGSHTLAGINVGSSWNAAGYLNGNIAFVGVYTGDVRAHANWNSFKSWVSRYYGITLA